MTLTPENAALVERLGTREIIEDITIIGGDIAVLDRLLTAAREEGREAKRPDDYLSHPAVF